MQNSALFTQNTIRTWDGVGFIDVHEAITNRYDEFADGTISWSIVIFESRKNLIISYKEGKKFRFISISDKVLFGCTENVGDYNKWFKGSVPMQ